jgi:hypothetical protein
MCSSKKSFFFRKRPLYILEQHSVASFDHCPYSSPLTTALRFGDAKAIQDSPPRQFVRFGVAGGSRDYG